MEFNPHKNLDKIRRLTFELSSMPAKYNNVLIVDDIESCLALTKHQLSKRGYKVFTSTCGEEAVKILETKPIDAVILDYCMPGMNGIQLLEKIQGYKIRKVLLTSYLPTYLQSCHEGSFNKALELGATFVEKPFKPEYLEEVI